jgi:hypothetical protein
LPILAVSPEARICDVSFQSRPLLDYGRRFSVSVQSLANQLKIGFGEGQRTVLHHRKIIVVPPGFHDSFSGVVQSSLQNVRNLMGNYMR